MTVEIRDDFDLQKIAESGQSFRWQACADGGYRVQAGEKLLEIRQITEGRQGKSFEVSCTQEEWADFWSSYFDLGTDYAGIRSTIRGEEDPYLYTAAEDGRGIRILCQDPWEMLITFIISQRKTIPAIRGCVEKLCRAAGRKCRETLPAGRDAEERMHPGAVPGSKEAEYYAFPSPEELAALTEEELSSCGLGYRTTYIAQVAAHAANGEIPLEEMKHLDDTALLVELMRLPGVGIKVASCVLLFGFHRLNVFPKDVWINRVFQEHYPGGFPFARYAPYCGVMQQYLFYERRLEAEKAGTKRRKPRG